MNQRLVYPVLLLSLLAVIFAGCGAAEGSDPEEPLESPAAAAAMPEQMPGDFAFSVRYGITAKNEINTFKGRVTKDLISKGSAAAKLRLTDAEISGIYQQMREMNVLGDMELEIADKSCRQAPYEEEHWIIRVNGEQKELAWSEEYCQIPPDAKKLKELRTRIVKLVQSKSEYQALPEAVGGYD
ncbi:hypothetical protein [Paenibacillus graminis]|uniref:hypothetical protein n=2 Tax=Paenibacillus graminis TaxID=189425 RepID=UPI00069422BB|nr:hypothetical protein [Paenibacillus graminis]